jgi:hypothetical protein
MAVNGAGEMSYLWLFSAYGGPGGFVDYVVYEGAGRTRLSHGHLMKDSRSTVGRKAGRHGQAGPTLARA